MGLLRISLVTCEQEFANEFGELVRANGHDVDIHRNEQTAVQAARLIPPHVVFVDQTSLPTDGRQICRQVRDESLRPARLVAITVDETSDTISACRAAGFDFRFSKPVVAEDLERFLAVCKAELV
jgi:DNA-binding response OmpR family regulator